MSKSWQQVLFLFIPRSLHGIQGWDKKGEKDFYLYFKFFMLLTITATYKFHPL